MGHTQMVQPLKVCPTRPYEGGEYLEELEVGDKPHSMLKSRTPYINTLNHYGPTIHYASFRQRRQVQLF
jgi:hypothetical protein